ATAPCSAPATAPAPTPLPAPALAAAPAPAALAAPAGVGVSVNSSSSRSSSVTRINNVASNNTSVASTSMLSVEAMSEAFRHIRTKLLVIQQLSNACSAAVGLMGDDECESNNLEGLSVRLLQRAQEVHDALQLTQDIPPPSEDGTAEESTTAAPATTSIYTCVAALVKAYKSLQNENATLLQQEEASEKQKSFLLRDIEQTREELMKEEKLLKSRREKLTEECEQLRRALENATDTLQERDAALKDVQQQNAALQDAVCQHSAECEQLRLQLATLHATREDMQQSLTVLRDASVMVRRASAAVHARLRSVAGMPPDDPTDATRIGEQQQQQQEGGAEKPTGMAADDVRASASQLLAASGRDLRLCGGVLQHLEENVRGAARLLEALQQTQLWAKGETAESEACIRAVLRDACRDEAALLGALQSLSRR
ncbi:hypothetical protein DQ04_21281000, partial [Trypanosoma grayi]|uniref:hypothetical protein n=1 Tax=Trypanosoma grayi TaxID=71804 RepID=UPI0004F4B104